jgi:hypothetical protein
VDGVETVLANLSPGVRREKRDGREWLVARVTKLVPGVHAGSMGPVYYPPELLSKGAEAWEGLPVLVRHPQKDGRPTSVANAPDCLAAQAVGRVHNATADGRLKGEAWIDEEAARRVDPRLLEALYAGRPVGVSTGFSSVEMLEAAAGQPHKYVAQSLTPDHLAVLIDEPGACGLDRCGLLVNAKLSHADLRQKLESLLWEAAGPSVSVADDGSMENEDHPYVIDVFDRHVVYARRQKLWRQGYATDLRTGSVALSDDPPVEVVRTTEYKPVANAAEEDQMNDADRKAAIDYLVANCRCWQEGDRETLAKLPAEKLQALKAATEQSKRNEAVANAATAGFEDEQGNLHAYDPKAGRWEVAKKTPPPPPVQNALTPEQQQTLAWAYAEQARQKGELVERLVANAAEADRPAQRDRLMRRPIEDLRADLALLPPAPQPHQWQAPLANNYAGLAPLPPAHAEAPLEKLSLPRIEWSTKRED